MLKRKPVNWFTVFLGACFFVISAWFWWYEVDFYIHSRVVVGEVVKLNSGGYHPEVAFTTEQGERIRFAASSSHSLEVGDRVEVRYGSSDPRMRPKLNQILTLFTFFPAVAGVLFMISGFLGKSANPGEDKE